MSKHHFGPGSAPGIARKAAGDLQQRFGNRRPAARAMPQASAMPAPGAGTIQPAQPAAPMPMLGGQGGSSEV